jgi:carbon monoxide dehydrogenase subunit G
VKLENSFDVEAPPEAAWELLMDVPRVIPCMPGAKLLDTIDDANWKAQLDVKLGPIGLTFATDVKRDSADEVAQVATLSARARETRGRGGGQAKIESRLTPTESGTHVDIVTDLALSGPVAQYGRGLIEDVTRQLVGRFADCLRTQLTAATPEEAEAATAVHAKPVAGVRLGLGALASSVARRFRRPRPAA